MTNANELMVAGLENNDGTIYPRGVCPCLSKILNQRYESWEAWNVSLPVE
jgi:hypothetical protein